METYSISFHEAHVTTLLSAATSTFPRMRVTVRKHVPHDWFTATFELTLYIIALNRLYSCIACKRVAVSFFPFLVVGDPTTLQAIDFKQL